MRWGWRPYVSAAQRRANAAREAAKITKSGRKVSPVRIAGRTIATSFWGKAWCENLESYSDYENRLPRGRTYVRNGSVLDLQIKPGAVTALVSGSSIYKIAITIKPLAKSLWGRVQSACAGQIDSLIGLLQGRLSDGVMKVVTDPASGLFPKPAEISLSCSCPDWAGMCKHVAATLYGVGSRLDQQPDLLFTLRGVDPSELISKASAADALQQTAPADGATIADSDLAEVFGIELENPSPAPAAHSPNPKRAARPRTKRSAAAKPESQTPALSPPVKKPARKPKRQAAKKSG